jgi:hypothetical protein
MDTLLVIILSYWLATSQGLLIDRPVTVEVMSKEDIETLSGRSAYAVYSSVTQLILLSSDVDLNTIRGESILLHELVHHYQNISGLNSTYFCLNQAERLAYTTQKKYIIEKGGYVMPELASFNILMRSMCDGMY